MPSNNRNLYYADPFGIKNKVDNIIYCERFDSVKQKGIICRIKVDDNMQVLEETISLSPGQQVSYCFLIEEEGRLWAVPETSRLGRVMLYKVDTDSGKMIEPTVLLEEKISDPTLFKYEDYWWLFGVKNGSANLYTWYAEYLQGPWHSHSNNPVKIDISNARPAGTPFYWKGRIYRPAQDCSRQYGWRTVINRIDVLTPYRFVETAVNKVKLDDSERFSCGPHTISKFGDHTLIDGYEIQFRPYLKLLRYLTKEKMQ
jgi:hypothetical protein